jgi:hypothetical protein
MSLQIVEGKHMRLFDKNGKQVFNRKGADALFVWQYLKVNKNALFLPRSANRLALKYLSMMVEPSPAQIRVHLADAIADLLVVQRLIREWDIGKPLYNQLQADMETLNNWHQYPEDSTDEAANKAYEIYNKIISELTKQILENQSTVLIQATTNIDGITGVQTIAALLAQGSNPNAIDSLGRSPLTSACNGKTALSTIAVNILLNHGANINYQSNNSSTPLLNAISVGNNDTAELLLAHNPDLDLQENVDGLTALHSALLHDRDHIAELLIDKGASLNIQANAQWYRYTPIHMAINCDKAALLELMLARKPDLTLKNSDGYTAYEFAGESLRDVFNNADEYSSSAEKTSFLSYHSAGAASASSSSTLTAANTRVPNNKLK